MDEAIALLFAHGRIVDFDQIRLRHEGLIMDVNKQLAIYPIRHGDFVTILVVDLSQTSSELDPTMPRDIFLPHSDGV